MRSRCLYRWCACLGALLLWAMPASAAPFRVLVRTGDEDGSKLAYRIQGQASDLPVDIAVTALGELEPAMDAQLRAADRLAAEHDAQAVVWLERAKHRGARSVGWQLCILHPGRGRVLVRSLGDGTDQRHASSALLEEAALVVRATLQALVAGNEIGVERSVVERPAPQPKSFPSRRAARSPVPARPAPTLAGAGGGFSVNAGWQLALDGKSPLGQQGPTLDAAYSGASWQVGLTLAGSLGSELDSGPATLRLARHTAAGRMALRLVAGRWELAGGARFGVALFARSTTSTASGFVPSADRTYGSLLVGPELSLSFHPQWPRPSWSIGFVAGADYVPRAPELGVGTPGEFQRLDALWLVHPRLGVCAELEL